ncbi:hypothetical protein SAM19_04723 [Brevibacillus laterosporus]|nr:hypothetical protein [Brevibacillus laterosporus]
MPLSLFGEAKITIACNQEGITSFSNEYVNDYILATLLRTNDSERLGLYLTYSTDGVVLSPLSRQCKKPAHLTVGGTLYLEGIFLWLKKVKNSNVIPRSLS